jgi:hypothetical protein
MREDLKPGTVLRKHREALSDLERILTKAISMTSNPRELKRNRAKARALTIQARDLARRSLSLSEEEGQARKKGDDLKVLSVPEISGVGCEECGKPSSHCVEKQNGELEYFCSSCLEKRLGRLGTFRMGGTR